MFLVDPRVVKRDSVLLRSLAVNACIPKSAARHRATPVFPPWTLLDIVQVRGDGGPMTRLGSLWMTGVLGLGLMSLASCKSESEAPERKAGGARASVQATPAAKKGDYEGMASVAGAGKITGVVTYAGEKTDPEVTVEKDKCAHAAGTHPEHALVVNEKHVANAVVYIDKIAKGKKHDPATVTINNLNCAFSPRVQVAMVGDTVAAKNSDPILHNTHLYLSQGNKNLFNIALPKQGQVIEKTFKKPGLVDVKCDAHAWMQGWVYVAPHPYVTVTGPDGTFSLDEVPPGEYTVKFWHEELGEKEATAKVEAGGTVTLEVSM